jgi:PAS domain-containing protein
MQNFINALKHWRAVALGAGASGVLVTVLAFTINWREISNDRDDRAYNRLENLYDKQSLDLETVKEELEFRTAALDILQGAREDEPLITWLKDLSGRYVDANRAFFDQLIVPNHLDPDIVLGHTDAEIWPDSSLAAKYRSNDLEVIRLRQMIRFTEIAEVGGQSIPYVSYKHPVYGTVSGRRSMIATAGIAHEDCQ